MVEFKAPTEIIETYEVEMKRDERIMRFLTIRNDKYAAEWAEKRRTRKSTAK